MKKTRNRKYITPAEFEQLLKTNRLFAKSPKEALKFEVMLLMLYQHGLRASEVIDVRWNQINLDTAEFYVARLKNGRDSTHTLSALLLRRLVAHRKVCYDSPYVFVTNRKGPYSYIAIQKRIVQLGKQAHLPINIHPHTLRHSCGFHLAQSGAGLLKIGSYLGHRDINNTRIYTQLAAKTLEKLSRVW